MQLLQSNLKEPQVWDDDDDDKNNNNDDDDDDDCFNWEKISLVVHSLKNHICLSLCPSACWSVSSYQHL